MKNIVLILGIIMSFVLVNNNKEEYIYIPNEAIRVRVIANSYDSNDIEIKEKLKEKLNNKLNDLLMNAQNINDVRDIINNNLIFIHNFVDKSLKELNYNLDFSINYGMNYFPKKLFKGVFYKSGLYESLVITLGDGKGPNYWCVLYPPLCIIDDSKKTEPEYKLFIKELIDKYI